MSLSLVRRTAAAVALVASTAVGAAAQSLPGDVTATGAGATIFDLSTASSTISLANPGAVLGAGNNVTVRINGLTHSYMSDLGARLRYTPLGGGATIEAQLFYHVGDGSNPNGSFSFNDGFTTSITNIDYSGGDFAPNPVGALSVFNGVNVAGDWTLLVIDDVGRDAGAFQSWDIGLNTTVATTTTPEPGTWALMGTGLLGLAAAARRRRSV